MKALGDLNRFRIMLMLMERPLCVCELLEVLDIAGGTLSNHLKILREAELIDQRKDGRWIEYFIGSEAPRPLLDHLRESMEDDPTAAADRTRIRGITRLVCSGHMKNNAFKAIPAGPEDPA